MGWKLCQSHYVLEITFSWKELEKLFHALLHGYLSLSSCQRYHQHTTSSILPKVQPKTLNCFCFHFLVLGVKLCASWMLSKCCTIELYSLPCCFALKDQRIIPLSFFGCRYPSEFHCFGGWNERVSHLHWARKWVRTSEWSYQSLCDQDLFLRWPCLVVYGRLPLPHSVCVEEEALLSPTLMLYRSHLLQSIEFLPKVDYVC